MSLTKQAKVLSKNQQVAVLSYLETTRQSKRNKVAFLLSFRAGLRAKEIAELKWSMVTDAESTLSDCIKLTNAVSKGRSGGVVYMSNDLKNALETLKSALGGSFASEANVIQSERGKAVSAQVIVNLFWLWFKRLGFDGASSHSGRRSFITNAARNISKVGGSIKDVQMLARHSSLQMTQRYIEADVEAQRKVVEL